MVPSARTRSVITEIAPALRLPSTLSAAQIQETIIASISEFSAGDFHDDVTVLVVQIT